MITVLAITSVLALLTMGSFRSIQSTGLAASGNQIADVLAMARENSISKSAYTAVVIKTQGTAANSAYCLFQLIRNDDGSLPSTWTAVTPWRYLSNGVVFENSGTANDTFMTWGSNISSNTVSANTPSTLPQPLSTSFPFQGQSIDLTTMTASQCFQPDGTLLNSQTAPTLRLVPQHGNSSDYYNLTVLSNTGVTVVNKP